MFAGIAVMALSFFLASRFTVRTPHSAIMAVVYLRGFGMGLTFAPLNAFSLRNLNQNQMAAAAGISNSIKQLAGSISIALLTAIMTSRIAYHTARDAGSRAEAYVSGVTDDFTIVVMLTLASALPFLLPSRRADVIKERIRVPDCFDGYPPAPLRKISRSQRGRRSSESVGQGVRE